MSLLVICNNTYCVYCDNNTHLDHQIAQTSALIEVFTLTVIFKSSVFDYQHLPATIPHNSYGSSKGVH